MPALRGSFVWFGKKASIEPHVSVVQLRARDRNDSWSAKIQTTYDSGNVSPPAQHVVLYGSVLVHDAAQVDATKRATKKKVIPRCWMIRRLMSTVSSSSSSNLGGPVQQRIEAKLREALAPLALVIENESDRHAGPRGRESHFNVAVASAKFDNLSFVHFRLIYLFETPPFCEPQCWFVRAACSSDIDSSTRFSPTNSRRAACTRSPSKPRRARSLTPTPLR